VQLRDQVGLIHGTQSALLEKIKEQYQEQQRLNGQTVTHAEMKKEVDGLVSTFHQLLDVTKEELMGEVFQKFEVEHHSRYQDLMSERDTRIREFSDLQQQTQRLLDRNNRIEEEFTLLRAIPDEVQYHVDATLAEHKTYVDQRLGGVESRAKAVGSDAAVLRGELNAHGGNVDKLFADLMKEHDSRVSDCIDLRSAVAQVNNKLGHIEASAGVAERVAKMVEGAISEHRQQVEIGLTEHSQTAETNMHKLWVEFDGLRASIADLLVDQATTKEELRACVRFGDQILDSRESTPFKVTFLNDNDQAQAGVFLITLPLRR